MAFALIAVPLGITAHRKETSSRIRAQPGDRLYLLLLHYHGGYFPREPGCAPDRSHPGSQRPLYHARHRAFLAPSEEIEKTALPVRAFHGCFLTLFPPLNACQRKSLVRSNCKFPPVRRTLLRRLVLRSASKALTSWLSVVSLMPPRRSEAGDIPSGGHYRLQGQDVFLYHKVPPASVLSEKAAGLAAGSKEPNKTKVAKLSKAGDGYREDQDEGISTRTAKRLPSTQSPERRARWESRSAISLRLVRHLPGR